MSVRTCRLSTGLSCNDASFLLSISIKKVWIVSNVKKTQYHIELKIPGIAHSLVPRLWGRGEKRAWYLLFTHALNYLTFQSFWISSDMSVLCWRHQPISRTLNFTLAKWIVCVCSWMPRLCFCDFERWTNSLRQGQLWRKGRISLAAYRFWQVNVLWSTALRVWWQARKTWQNH